MTDTLPTVLYVEDDAQSRKLMSLLLKVRMRLPDVTIFEDSTDFLARVESLAPKPDLILLDIHMKPHDGFEMLHMLRSLSWAKDLPIIALTASVMSEEIDQLQEAGFDGCLGKPIDMDVFPELFDRIHAGENIWRVLS